MRRVYMLLAAPVILSLSLIFPISSSMGAEPCNVGAPLYQTTHEDVIREVPLPTSGVVVLAGHSNAQRVNPYLGPLLAAQGITTVDAGFPGHDSGKWADTTLDEFDILHQRLVAMGKTEANVTGWVWVAMQKKTETVTQVNDPSLVDRYTNEMMRILPMLQSKYPNLVNVWIASPQASFSKEIPYPANQEPSPWRQGAVSMRIANTYVGPLHIIPGPYVWTDQVCGRADGLAFTKAEYEADGVHPGPVAAQRYAQYMTDFFVNVPSPTTTTTSTTIIPTTTTTTCGVPS